MVARAPTPDPYPQPDVAALMRAGRIIGPVEQAFIRVLAEAPGRYLATRHIIDTIYGRVPGGGPQWAAQSLAVTAMRLRAKLAGSGWTVEGRQGGGRIGAGAYRLVRPDAPTAGTLDAIVNETGGVVRQAILRHLARTPGRWVPTKAIAAAAYGDAEPPTWRAVISATATDLRRNLAGSGWRLEGRAHHGYRLTRDARAA